jgi:hypothetical protein
MIGRVIEDKMFKLNTEDATKAATDVEADSKPATTLSATACPPLYQDLPSIEDANALIAAKMTRLSMEERDQVLHDIHGVWNDLEETPEQLHASLIKLQTELCQVVAIGFYPSRVYCTRNPLF